MAATQRFLIAPYSSGLENDVKPWLIPDEAFSTLQNMYVWRGRVRKRLGSQLLFGDTAGGTIQQLYSRLRIKLNATDGSGNQLGTVPGSFAVSPPSGTLLNKIGGLFSIGTQLFTVQDVGTPILMLNTGSGTGTYDTTNGSYVFTGVTPSMDIYFYPALPVMGFAVVQTNAVNFERYLAFDTQFAYEYGASTGWTRLSTGAATWTGDDADFFYSSMYRAVTSSDLALFTTNNTPSSTGDGIRYFLASTNTWTQLTQSYSASANTLILGARIVIQFKGRLLLFNTFEQPGSATTVQYVNRVRFSQFGNPTTVDAWYQAPEVYGLGGFIDAPTQQQIISAEIFRDRMIVYFEASTWELVYTNNEIQPFRWQNINIELGSESTFSLIPFDKGIMGIGAVGIHVTNGINVSRIDDKIPDYVFSIQNKNNGPERVQGIRDYYDELAYWTLPNVDSDNPDVVYPNQMLVYNYQNNSWAIWDDSITCLGYINLNNALSWDELTYLTWEEWSTEWNSGSNQSRFLRVLAGNQEGYTFYLTRDTPRCAGALQITDISISGAIITLTIINNNFTNNNWVLIENVQGTGNITDLNEQIYPVIAYSVNTITIIDASIGSGTYTGGGTVAIVPQILMETKQYNFFIDKGVNFAVDKVDFLVEKTEQPTGGGPAGQVSVDALPSTGSLPSNVLPFILETTPYNPIYYPYESAQDLLWHSIYPNITGSYVQFRISWNRDQMINPLTSLADFTLHSMLFYATMTDSRLQ